MGHSPCEDTVAFQCSGVSALFYFYLWEHYKLSTEEKLTIWHFLAVWQGHQKLFVFILTKSVQQAFFTQISGLFNPPMKPEADVIIDIYTGKY